MLLLFYLFIYLLLLFLRGSLLLLFTNRLTWHLVRKLQGHVTRKKENSDVFGRWKHSRSQRHYNNVANKYVFNLTNNGKLFHATGKARSPIVLRRVTGTTTDVDELERKRRLRLVSTSAARVMLYCVYVVILL